MVVVPALDKTRTVIALRATVVVTYLSPAAVIVMATITIIGNGRGSG
jgi:hypothetical protein